MKTKNLSCLLPLLLLTACNDLASLDQRLNVKLDPALSQDKVNLLKADISKLASLQITESTPDGYFKKVFNSSDASGVLQFVDDRVHYIIPAGDDLSQRLRLKVLGVNISLPQSSSSSDSTCGPDTETGKMAENLKNAQSDGSAVVGALNVGTSLWLASTSLKGGIGLSFSIGKQDIPLDSPRVGIVELGDGYAETLRNKPMTAIYRTSIVIHEARHSDCTGGYDPNEFAEMAQACALPKNKECGHLHSICPEGHVLAGLPACDDAAWGAYAVEGIYAREVYHSCKNCSEVEKQEALAMATDAFSRVAVLDDMMAGKLGDPDMSSSSLARTSDPAIAEIEKAVASIQSR